MKNITIGLHYSDERNKIIAIPINLNKFETLKT